MVTRQHKLSNMARLLVALFAMTAMPIAAQENIRKPAKLSAASSITQTPKAITIKKANGATKTAYGVLGFDLTDGNMLNGLVSFPVTDGARFTLVKYFGDQTHDVTAGAYAAGYYYAERTETDLETQAMIPVELVRYDMERDEVSTVGALSGYTSHINDMSYDYSSNTMYAISVYNNAYSQLFTIDLNNAESKKVADLDRRFFTLACSYGGQLYGISFEGDLCKIDKQTGNVELIGATGWRPTYYQSMEFDHTDETLYWAANLIEGTDYTDCIARVDTTTGQAEKVAAVGNSPQIAGLYVPFSASANGTPSAVSDLLVAPDENGAQKVNISWLNPTETFDGKTLTSLSAVKVFRDRELIKTFDNPVPGDPQSIVDVLNSDKGAFHNYSIIAYNEQGAGAEEKAKVFVGHDTPLSVGDLKVNVDGFDKAVVSWQQPTGGVNGGYLDKASLKYNVVRQPDGKIVASGVADVSATDEQITPVGQYSYVVTAINADGESESVATTPQVLGPAYTLPVAFDFTSSSADNSWTVADVNGDGYAWTWTETTEGKVMGHQASSVQQSDDWLIAYYMPFEKGVTYTVDIDLHAYSADQLNVSLLDNMNYLAPVQDIASQTISGSRERQKFSFVFKSEQDGYRNLALHAVSPMRADWLEMYSLSVRQAEDENMAAIAISGDETPMVGKESTYNVRVENRGVKTIYGFRVQLDDQNGNVLAQRDVAKTLKTGESADVEMTWKPESQNVTAVYGEVTMPWTNDGNADDNKTAPMAVSVREAYNGELVSIGTESTTTASYSPFDFSNQYAAALNIYSSAEIGMDKDMAIEKVAWPYDAAWQYADVEKAPVRVYMANTDLADTKDGWIPEDQLKLVFDGTVDIAKQSTGELPIVLDMPFRYEAGKNLAVLTVINCDTYAPYISFAQYTSPLEGNCALEWGSYYAKQWFDFTQTGHQDYYERMASIMLYMNDDLQTGISAIELGSEPGTSYSLYDAAGRKVAEGKLDAAGCIDTRMLGKGVYVATYKAGGRQKSMKICVNK